MGLVENVDHTPERNYTYEVIFLSIKRLYSVNEDENTVIIDKNFFEALFINQSSQNKRTLSSVSLRLAALLLQELDEFEAKELPSRKSLAECLNTSRTSIINSLVQLEESGFIKRQVSILQVIQGPSNKEKERYYKVGEDHLKQRNFSDKFSINKFYNQNPISLEDVMKKLGSVSNENLNNYITNENFIKKLHELEERMEKLEEMMKE